MGAWNKQTWGRRTPATDSAFPFGIVQCEHLPASDYSKVFLREPRVYVLWHRSGFIASSAPVWYGVPTTVERGA